MSSRLLHRLGRVKAVAPRYAVGAAWFFAVFSLVNLAWVIGAKWGDTAGMTTLYQTTVETISGPETHRAWGLAYPGATGLMLAVLQAGAVLAALIMSTRPRGRVRKLGHGVLIAWASLWTLDLVHLASLDGRVDSLLQASFMTLLAACTIFRAVRPVGERATPGEDVAELFEAPMAGLEAPDVDDAPGPPLSTRTAVAEVRTGAKTVGRGLRGLAGRALDRGRRLPGIVGRAVAKGGRKLGRKVHVHKVEINVRKVEA
jgi:hypothetical protein